QTARVPDTNGERASSHRTRGDRERGPSLGGASDPGRTALRRRLGRASSHRQRSRLRPRPPFHPRAEQFWTADDEGTSQNSRRTISSDGVGTDRHPCRGRAPHPRNNLNRDMIRVLCVDDHALVREGIALTISREPDMKLVGSLATGEEAIEFFTSHTPDITLM